MRKKNVEYEKEIFENLKNAWDQGDESFLAFLNDLPKNRITQKIVKKFFRKYPVAGLVFFHQHIRTVNPLKFKKVAKELNEKMKGARK